MFQRGPQAAVRCWFKKNRSSEPSVLQFDLYTWAEPPTYTPAATLLPLSTSVHCATATPCFTAPPTIFFKPQPSLPTCRDCHRQPAELISRNDNTNRSISCHCCCCCCCHCCCCCFCFCSCHCCCFCRRCRCYHIRRCNAAAAREYCRCCCYCHCPCWLPLLPLLLLQPLPLLPVFCGRFAECRFAESLHTSPPFKKE